MQDTQELELRVSVPTLAKLGVSIVLAGRGPMEDENAMRIYKAFMSSTSTANTSACCCGYCGALLAPLNGPDAAGGETWAHPVVEECPWSEWEGLTTPQVNALWRLATAGQNSAR